MTSSVTERLKVGPLSGSLGGHTPKAPFNLDFLSETALSQMFSCRINAREILEIPVYWFSRTFYKNHPRAPVSTCMRPFALPQ